ncbi:MAG: type II 3-dehydroquinate dehydratase [Bacilli bacterium]|jgi:3-dehydroquinate dehydratase-2
MKILVINGPNLNMLGIREPEIYGSKTYKDLEQYIQDISKKLNISEIEIFQSNHEGVIVDKIQKAYFDKVDGIIINPGAFTHYSYSIRDAIASVNIKTIEVHLSDISKRDDFRKTSVLEGVVNFRFFGKGFASYKEALESLVVKN